MHFIIKIIDSYDIETYLSKIEGRKQYVVL